MGGLISALNYAGDNVIIRRPQRMPADVLQQLAAIGRRTASCVFITNVTSGTIDAFRGIIDTSMMVLGHPLPEAEDGVTPALRDADLQLLEAQVAEALAGAAPVARNYRYTVTNNGDAPQLRCLLKRVGPRDAPLGVRQPAVVGVAHLLLPDRTPSEQEAETRLFADVFEQWLCAAAADRPAVEQAIRVAADALQLTEASFRRQVADVLDDRAKQEFQLASYIHDDISQQLGVAAGILSVLSSTDARFNETREEAQLNAVRDLVDEALAATRRTISALQPPPTDDALSVALRQLAEQAVPSATVQLDVEGTVRLTRQARAHVYCVAREALANVRKHARAHLVRVALRDMGREVHLLVRDDGCGFSPREQASRGGSAFGLLSMKTRALLLGGRLDVASHPGSGTSIVLRVPKDAMA